eukprot:6309601-Heterocapsa_arctica.AAC.1
MALVEGTKALSLLEKKAIAEKSDTVGFGGGVQARDQGAGPQRPCPVHAPRKRGKRRPGAQLVQPAGHAEEKKVEDGEVAGALREGRTPVRLGAGATGGHAGARGA